MNKELPCYVVLDLLPLYQEDIILQETKRDIDKHMCNCSECKKALDNLNAQIDIRITETEVKNNPLKKIRFYQKMQMILGTIVAFFLGLCLPIVKMMIPIIQHGGIPDYYLARLKVAWHIGLLKMGISGFVVCVIYLIVLFGIRKMISRKLNSNLSNS